MRNGAEAGRKEMESVSRPRQPGSADTRSLPSHTHWSHPPFDGAGAGAGGN